MRSPPQRPPNHAIGAKSAHQETENLGMMAQMNLLGTATGLDALAEVAPAARLLFMPDPIRYSTQDERERAPSGRAAGLLTTH